MALTRVKSKGRKANGSYVQLPHAIFQSAEYAELNAHAVKLLIDLFIQYRGDNNGDFTAAWSVMRQRGWLSKETLYRAISTLTERGWIIKTRQGGKHVCSLYGVTWLPIDECNGKLDIKPTRIALGTWKRSNDKSVVRLPDHIGTPTGPIGERCRVN
jgi:hypothetical protein